MAESDDSRAKGLLKNYSRLRSRLEAKRNALATKIRENARLCREDALVESATEFRQLSRTLKFLEQLCPKEPSKERKFVFSSLLLDESFKLCCELPDMEGMHFIVGIEHDELLIGTKLVPFPYSHRSIVTAGGDHGSTHKISIEMFEAGHVILALMHSHPDNGIDGNHCSSTDMETQKQWERGWPMISGIWSRDGFLRFFSHKLVFEVKVSGNHIRKVEHEESVFQLES